MTFLKRLAATAAMAVATAAQAGVAINFDPTGTGSNYITIDALDWLPGSALSAGVNTASGLTSSPFTTYYQANLGNALFNNNAVYANTAALGGNYFTAVAAFGEQVTGCVDTLGAGFCTLASFGFNSQLPNYFTIYANSSLGNNLTGAGFGTGKAILTAQVIGTGFSGSFSLSGVPSPNCTNSGGSSCLDQHTTNDWGSTSSVQGAGGAKLQVQIVNYDHNFFSGLNLGDIITFSTFNTNNNIPFTDVDPSKCVFDATKGASADCSALNGGRNSLVGSYNGLPGSGPDVLFQADASSSFLVARVPEPSSMALVGLGLLGIGVVARRRAARKS